MTVEVLRDARTGCAAEIESHIGTVGRIGRRDRGHGPSQSTKEVVRFVIAKFRHVGQMTARQYQHVPRTVGVGIEDHEAVIGDADEHTVRGAATRQQRKKDATIKCWR